MAHLSQDQTETLARRFAAELAHLEDCPECRRRIHEVAAREERAYRTALANAKRRTLERAPRVRAEKISAPDLMSELLDLPEVERETALALDSRFHSYALAVCLLKRSERATPCNPEHGRELARLARVVTEQVDPRSCGGTGALADLEAYTFALEAEALRVSGLCDTASGLFTEARLRQQRGGADPDLGARVDLLEASLRRELGQPALALALLDRAADAFVALQEHELLARTLLLRTSLSEHRQRRLPAAGADFQRLRQMQGSSSSH